MSGADIIVSALVIGALIEALPPSHTVVEVEGTQYYHDDRYYYKQRPEGDYVVVPPVKVKSRPQSNYGRREEEDGRRNEGNRGDSRR